MHRAARQVQARRQALRRVALVVGEAAEQQQHTPDRAGFLFWYRGR
jgi:hypothetical protein